jgi:hypothetical protein
VSIFSKKNIPKKAIAQTAKIRPLWSHCWSVLLFLCLDILQKGENVFYPIDCCPKKIFISISTSVDWQTFKLKVNIL